MISDHALAPLRSPVNSPMSERLAKATTLYAAAFLQGVCLVLIPAASSPGIEAAIQKRAAELGALR